MTSDKKTYEAMFLIDAGNPDFEAATEPIRNVLARSEAEVLSMKPWEERRLAYEIKGRRRGLYVLAYLAIDPLRVKEIEHDCQLNENILRLLILVKDGVTEEIINADTPAVSQSRRVDEAAAAAAAAEAEAEAKAAEEAAPAAADADAKAPEESVPAAADADAKATEEVEPEVAPAAEAPAEEEAKDAADEPGGDEEDTTKAAEKTEASE